MPRVRSACLISILRVVLSVVVKGKVILKISGTTRVLAIFGDPVAHSLSPLMQNRALEQAGIDAVYVPYRVPAAGIGAAMAGVRALGIWGANLTVPLKEAVCPHLDALDDDARLIGAVNTLVNQDGRLVGHNTDGYGFLNSLEVDLKFQPAGKRILLLGAGGACRAALVALCRAGASRVSIANRSLPRAESLVAEFKTVFPGTSLAGISLDTPDLTCALKDADLLVNTTTVGLKGEVFADLPWSGVPAGIPVLDMVYGAGPTPLVDTARQHGHPATSGLGMLAGQGERAFELWTGVKPPAGVMRRCLLAANPQT